MELETNLLSFQYVKSENRTFYGTEIFKNFSVTPTSSSATAPHLK